MIGNLTLILSKFSRERAEQEHTVYAVVAVQLLYSGNEFFLRDILRIKDILYSLREAATSLPDNSFAMFFTPNRILT